MIRQFLSSIGKSLELRHRFFVKATLNRCKAHLRQLLFINGALSAKRTIYIEEGGSLVTEVTKAGRQKAKKNSLFPKKQAVFCQVAPIRIFLFITRIGILRSESDSEDQKLPV